MLRRIGFRSTRIVRYSCDASHGAQDAGAPLPRSQLAVPDSAHGRYRVQGEGDLAICRADSTLLAQRALTILDPLISALLSAATNDHRGALTADDA
jgi:hypothetical protein